MDTALFLNITIFLLSLILIVVGVYLILLLNEARGSFKRANRILDRIDSASGFLERNFLAADSHFANVFSVVKEGMVFLAELKKTLKKDHTHER